MSGVVKVEILIELKKCVHLNFAAGNVAHYCISLIYIKSEFACIIILNQQPIPIKCEMSRKPLCDANVLRVLICHFSVGVFQGLPISSVQKYKMVFKAKCRPEMTANNV